jgi:hypothetical protein
LGFQRDVFPNVRALDRDPCELEEPDELVACAGGAPNRMPRFIGAPSPLVLTAAILQPGTTSDRYA